MTEIDDASVHELLQTLQAAMASLQAEMELLPKVEPVDQSLLLRLSQESAALYARAESLLDTMLGRNAEPALVDQADELLDFFSGAGERLESLMVAARRRSTL